MTTIVGHSYSEQLDGSDLNDRIYGQGGDDLIFGNLGNDVIAGQGGDDTLIGGQGDDRLYGSAGNDTLYGLEGRDRMDGGSGDDSLIDYQGHNVMYGGDGNDLLAGEGAMSGGNGDDTIIHEWGNGNVYGGAGQDAITVDLYATSRDDGNGVLIGPETPQHVTLRDFNPNEDVLHLNAADPLGNWFGFGDDTQVFGMFDDNHDGALTADDTYVDTAADGGGLELKFWNVTLEIDHTNIVTQDFLF